MEAIRLAVAALVSVTGENGLAVRLEIGQDAFLARVVFRFMHLIGMHA